MEENKLLDIARSLDNPQGINNEFLSSMDSIHKLINTKYTSQIYNALEAEQKAISNTPSKEVTLINAISMFASEEQKPALTRLTQILTSINTFLSLRQKIHSITLNADNIYQISSDEATDMISESTAKKTELLLLLALSGII